MYTPEPRDTLWQGDLFADVPIVEVSGEYRTEWQGRVLVISHECEVAKPNCTTALVSRVRDRDEFDGGKWGHIRANRVKQGMYVEAAEGVDEGFVDFRWTTRVRIEVLQDCEKIASLTDTARLALSSYLYRFFTRDEPPAPRAD